jgi:hypothetical protein
MNPNYFNEIARYLNHPLVLIGFVMMLVFGIHSQLLKAGILPKVSKKEGSRVIMQLLQYGFWLGVLIVMLGIGLKFFQDWLHSSS